MNKNFCILLDKNNDWLKPHAEIFLEKINLEIDKHLIFEVKESKKFEICFVLGYMKILNKESLAESCNYFVVHESSLPIGKGFSPLIWQVLEGKKEIETCLIELTHPVDSGRIAFKKSINLDGLELYSEIRAKQSEATFDLISIFLKKFPKIDYQPQIGESTFYKRRNPNDSKLNINKSIKDQFNHLRVCNNNDWPAYFEIDKQKYILKIYKSD